MKAFPQLQTSRFTLRQFKESDLEMVYKGLSHPEVIKYYGVSFSSLEETKEQMLWFKNLEKTNTGVWWAICSPDYTTFYGAGGFNNLDAKTKKTEVGFWLLPEHWRKGIMQEVMAVICQFAFTDLSIHRIEGFVDPENKNCKNALNKLGFQYEGTFKESEFKDGKYLDTDIYALIENRRVEK
jgi:ribosomal-protein-alanine N-acetyltransferase